ncbi:MAG: PorT family protein, partial [Calditrichaeota bacterium]
DYIEVPVLLKFLFGQNDVKPYAMVGPSIGYLLSSKMEYDLGIFGSGEEDIKDETKSIDFGVGFGGGVTMPMGKNSIFVEARYAIGFVNLNDDPEDTETEIKTNGFQVFVGMTFPIGK